MVKDKSDSSLKQNQEYGKKAVFGHHQFDFGVVEAAFAAIVLAFSFISFFLLAIRPQYQVADTTDSSAPQIMAMSSAAELMQKLEELGLLEIDDRNELPPVVLKSFPPDIDKLDISTRKTLFFHALLPSVMVALDEIKRERRRLEQILKNFGDDRDSIVFSVQDFAVWGRKLTRDEIEFVLRLSRKYRTSQASELLNRINLVPPSMILAQAAMESSWGMSRFSREGNNLFGIWTWGSKGIVPNARDNGKTHKVATYDSILDSLRAYLSMINRLPAYRNFRNLRRKTLNSLKLVEGLRYYSERRDEYVWEIKNIIRHNNLRRYDRFLANLEERQKKQEFANLEKRQKQEAGIQSST